MFKDEIRRKIADFRELGLPEYCPREGVIHLADRMVATLVGARRAGKSFRVLQLADEFLQAGRLPCLRAVCHLDFDNPLLGAMSAHELSAIQNTFLEVTPEFNLKSPLLFILDEIHKIPGWEEYVIDLSRNPHWQVVVTGSSSKLLRDDIATELRGKSISSTVYPLSFREFLTFNGYRHDVASTKGQAEAARWFEQYLTWGGYPALVGLAEYSREPLLREYFDTMILRDIIQRYNVSKPRQCIHVYRFLMSNISRPHTLKSAFEYLKEQDYSTSRDSIRDYLRWAEDSWLIFTVPIYSQSHKEQERNYRKVYSIDWALALHNSLVWDGSHSRALENLVYLHLRRRHEKVFYYLTRSERREVDFVALDSRGRPECAVQVCMSLAASPTAEREVKPLVDTCRYFGIENAWIITLNEEKLFTRDGVDVRVVPAWKWLLAEH